MMNTAINTIEEEGSVDMSTGSASPLRNIPTRQAPDTGLLQSVLSEETDEDHSSSEEELLPQEEEEVEEEIPYQPLYVDEYDSNEEELELEKEKKLHVERAPEESLQMPSTMLGESSEEEDDDDDDCSEDLDAALEKWADEIQRSAHTDNTSGTDPRDNCTPLEESFNVMKQLEWGHESLPAELEGEDFRVRSSLHTYHSRKTSNHYAYLEEPFKNEYDEKEDDYVCCGCMKREWNSSNPAMAIMIILMQICIVIIFVMLFYPGHNSHSVTNGTVVPATNGDIYISPTAIPTVFTPAPTVLESAIMTTMAPVDSGSQPVETPTPTASATTAAVPTITTSAPTTTDTSMPPTETTTTLAPTGSPTTAEPTPEPSIAVINASVSSAVPTGSPTSAEPTTSYPSQTPTITTLATTVFLEWLPQETQDVITAGGPTAQARAFDWMLQDYNWNSYEQPQAVQRFALATLYYATNGEDWNESQGWLDYTIHECDWAHVFSNSELYSSATTPICSSDLVYQSIQLANNNLQGTIPPELQLLTGLQLIDLSQNTNLTGNLPDVILEDCTDLQLMLLFENQLTGTIPAAIATLSDLQGFHAWDNGFTGPIFPGDLLRFATNLRQWHVGNNRLTGTFPTVQELERQEPVTSSPQQQQRYYFLESLWLYGNQMTGSLTSAMAQWTRLTSLLAWSNRLTGTLPPEIGTLTLLQQLDLEENLIGGGIPSELGLLSNNLKGLWLSSNNFTFQIPLELTQLPSLSILSLHGNSLTGTILEGIGEMTSLFELSLRDNFLTGTVPTQVGEMRSLRILEWDNNRLTGTLPTELGAVSNLERLHLSLNQLIGTLPTEIGQMSALQDLVLEENLLAESIPTQFGLLVQLGGLFIDQNAFTGAIPSELGLLFGKLAILDLSDNELTSTIPSELGRLMVSSGEVGGRLEQLRLFRNALSGSLATEFFPGDTDGSSLIQLAIEQNNFTGTIPTQIGRFTSLQEIRLSQNQFRGTLPTEIGSIRPVSLDLRENLFSGFIPSEIGFLKDRIMKLDLEQNQLTSSIPTEIGELSLLSSLKLSSNQLWWTIPTEIGMLSNNLQILHLAENTLAGSMPTQVGRMRQLREFHLDDNQFLFGSIPTFYLARLSNLVELTLNGTALTGSLPAQVCDISLLQVDCTVNGNKRTGLCGCDCDCSVSLP